MSSPTITYFILLIGGFMLLFSCNNASIIGSDLVDDSEFFSSIVSDTTSITTQCIKSDSVVTTYFSVTADQYAHTTYLLGSLNDPTFGQTTASIYAQMHLPNQNISLGTNTILDSVVLSLQYVDAYGDTTSRPDVYVHEVAEDIKAQTYFGSQEFAYSSNLLGHRANAVIQPKTKVALKKLLAVKDTLENGDIVTIDSIATEQTTPHLRIPLSTEFGYRLLAQSGTITFQNDYTFRQFLKGIYITTDNQSQTIASFNVSGAKSGVTLYYHNSTGNGKSLYMSFTSSTVTNRFRHNYSNTPLSDILQNTNNNQELLYVQGAEGVAVQFDLLNIAKLYDPQKVAINAAELQVTVLPDSEGNYPAPEQLALGTYDSLRAIRKSRISVADIKTTTNTEGQSLKTYTFRMPFHLQKMLEGEKAGEVLRIVVHNEQEKPHRAILCGPKHPQYPMKLKLVYTPVTED